MKTVAIVNSTAGSVGAHGAERLRRALTEVGLKDARIEELDRAASKIQIERIEASNPDLIVAWGGDGTHRAILEALAHRQHLLLLPGGTMNLLAKWLHGDRNWKVVLNDVLSSSTQRELPAGKANGRLFFCALLAGVPARVAAAREDVRLGHFGQALHDAGVAMSSLGATHLQSSFGADQLHIDRHLPLGNVIGALVGPTASNGRMEVLRASLPSTLSAIEFVWSSLMSGWRRLPGVSVEPADTLIIDDADNRPIQAIIDGEKLDPACRIEVSYVESAATCLVAAR